MLREVEFRGKHVHSLSSNQHLDGRWVYGYLSDKNYINSAELQGEFLVDEKTIGQYTGTKDKNGIKIYDGDRCIVTRPCVLASGQIKYIDGCPVFSEDKYGNLLTMLDLRLNGYEIKVVGNIHDDKTLLSQPSIDTE